MRLLHSTFKRAFVPLLSSLLCIHVCTCVCVCFFFLETMCVSVYVMCVPVFVANEKVLVCTLHMTISVISLRSTGQQVAHF